jgi:integrase
MGTVVRRGKTYRGMVRMAGHPTLTKTFDTAKEATTWVRNTETALEERVITNPKIRIADLIDKYEKEIAPKRKMAASHLGHDIPSIKRQFARMRMVDLMGKGLTDWVLDKQGVLTSVTAQWHVARLYGVLRQAEQHWDVAVPWVDMRKCVAKLTEVGYLQKPKERDRRVSDNELTRIKQALSKKQTINADMIFDFCLATAMRIGEVCRITWSDLNEANQTIVIRDRKHPTKKFGNHQTVPLLSNSLQIILAQPRSDERIFPRSTTYMSKVFHLAAVKAGVQDVVLHDLRHEGISRLFELGFAIQEVAMVSGHTNWRTLRRYTHLKPESLVEKERRLRLLAA